MPVSTAADTGLRPISMNAARPREKGRGYVSV
jgi:hypothetical protein